jgi:hypothetical protein
MRVDGRSGESVEVGAAAVLEVVMVDVLPGRARRAVATMSIGAADFRQPAQQVFRKIRSKISWEPCRERPSPVDVLVLTGQQRPPP